MINKNKLKEATDILNQLKQLKNEPKPKHSPPPPPPKQSVVSLPKPKPQHKQSVVSLPKPKHSPPPPPPQPKHSPVSLPKPTHAQTNAQNESIKQNRKQQINKYKTVNNQMINKIEENENRKNELIKNKLFYDFIDNANDGFLNKLAIYKFKASVDPSHYVYNLN